jgi:hypothetical protein
VTHAGLAFDNFFATEWPRLIERARAEPGNEQLSWDRLAAYLLHRFGIDFADVDGITPQGYMDWLHKPIPGPLNMASEQHRSIYVEPTDNGVKLTFDGRGKL